MFITVKNGQYAGEYRTNFKNQFHRIVEYKTNNKGEKMVGKFDSMTKVDFAPILAAYEAEQKATGETVEKNTAENTANTEKSESKKKKVKTDVTELESFPALASADNAGLKSWLDALASCKNMEVKTWEKIPGRHAVAAYGKNIALVTVNKNEKFAVHLNPKMLDGDLAGANIIKNGALSLYITKCNNVEAIVNLLEELAQARYEYAKDRTDRKINVAEVQLVKTEK